MNEDRIHSLDLLRGLAALAVAVPHFAIFKGWFVGQSEVVAVLAVEVFFVLSGYVLASQVQHCIAARSVQEVRTFLVRRWMRTVPAYWFALASITYMLAHFGSPQFYLYAIYSQNLAWASGSNDYYSVAWSLSVEEWAYIVIAVIVLCSFTMPRKYANLAMLAFAICFAGLAFRFVAPATEQWGEQVRRVVLYRIDAVAFGFAFKLAADRWAFASRSLLLLLSLWAASLTFALVILAASEFGAVRVTVLLFPWAAALFGGITIAVFLAVERHIPHWILPIASVSGRLSYSFYLFHLIFMLLVDRLLYPLTDLQQFVAFLIATGMFCWMFFEAVERPILRMRPAYRKAGHSSPATSASQSLL